MIGDVNGGDMESLLQDLRFGARSLVKKPAFAAIAVLALALGMGANTAIFSVVNAVVLRPLPFEDADRLVWMWGRFSQGSNASVSPPDFLDYRAQNTSFERLSAMRFNFFNLTEEGKPERLSGATVTTDFFDTLGIKPTRGRVFVADEESEGRNQVAVISEGLWRRRFGADPNIVGRALALDGVSYTVVGIVSMSFTLPQQAELWVPHSFDRPNMKARRFHFLRPLARLKSGVSIEQAQSEMDTIAAAAMILASVGIYGVMSYQISERTREIGIRMALGADSRAVLKLVIGHGLKLVGAGVAMGLAAAFALTRVLSNLLFGVQATDPLIFAGVSVLLVVVAMLACYLPARKATKVDPLAALRYE